MSNRATPVIALSGVRVAHGARAVLDVPALAVPAVETLGVMGPNGAGKSTLLRVLGLLEPPSAGTVRFRGEVVTTAQGLAVRRRMASVFQEPLLADTTVFDGTIQFIGDLRRGGFETTFGRSWHSNAFGLKTG